MPVLRSPLSSTLRQLVYYFASMECDAFSNSGEEYDALAEPVSDRRGQPRMLFAGEATTRYHPSTVHGAWLTGLREATRLDFHANAGWHRKGQRGKRDNSDFSPDVMYETSVLFDLKRSVPRARTGVRRGPGRMRQRPSKQSNGADCRRSPRLEPDLGVPHRGRIRSASADSRPISLRSLPHRLDGPAKSGARDRLRNMSNEQQLPLGRPIQISRGQEHENQYAGRGGVSAKRPKQRGR